MGNNCVSINLKKDQIVVKIAEDAEQKRIISELSRKISDLKKLYKDEKTIYISSLRILCSVSCHCMQ